MNNWPRWIFRAVTKHFQTMADDYKINMFIEGTNRQSGEKKHIEIRMLGPWIIELSHNYYKINVEVHIKWSINMDDEDFHEQQRLAGALLEAMSDICIYDDSDELWNTLTLMRTQNNYFGQIETDSQVVQGTVEGYFEIKTSGD